MAQSSPQKVVSSAENWLEAYLEVSLNGCPRFRMPDGPLYLGGEVASANLELGYQPIPPILGVLGPYSLRPTKLVKTGTAGLPGVRE
jgi:hypothetical protein